MNESEQEQRREIDEMTEMDERERDLEVGRNVWRKGSVTHRDIEATTLGNKLYLSWGTASQLQA